MTRHAIPNVRIFTLTATIKSVLQGAKLLSELFIDSVPVRTPPFSSPHPKPLLLTQQKWNGMTKL
jgi:hypothetical protein